MALFHREFVLVKFFFVLKTYIVVELKTLFFQVYLRVVAEKVGFILFLCDFILSWTFIVSVHSFSCTYGIDLLVLNCNLIHCKAFEIWCHNSTCGSSVSGVTFPCYVELISYNVLELKFVLGSKLFTTKLLRDL